MTPKYFTSLDDLHTWFLANHAASSELVIGIYKKDSGKAVMGYGDVLDEALCFGWIDGVRRSLGAWSYTIRLTPRRVRSIWSLVNIRRVRELTALGRMHPSGLKTFLERDEKRTQLYSFEQRSVKLGAKYVRMFKAKARAWKFFSAQSPSYKRTAVWFIMSAKKDETRLRRLGAVMKVAAEGKKLPQISGTK